MKTPVKVKMSSKKPDSDLDDNNIKYKINTNYFNNLSKETVKVSKKPVQSKNDDDNIRYRLPAVSLNSKSDLKPKPKPNKIKVNFWSNKALVNKRTLDAKVDVNKSNRRHTIAAPNHSGSKPKNNAVKVRKRVSFLPSPVFNENHVPMVTVPDDLTIQLNEEEANDLREDLNLAFVSNSTLEDRSYKKKNSQLSPKSNKRKRSMDEQTTVKVDGNDNELEFFSKYVVQKLRKMETNQRIYSENLINTVLMLGQLGKLNGKSKIGDA